jgi:hypothetical protein
LKQCQLPPIFACVVPDDVDAAVVASHLEVAVIGRQPAIDDIVNDDPSFAECEGAWRLLAFVAGVTLNRDPQHGVP